MEQCKNCNQGELVYDGFNDNWGCCYCGSVFANHDGPGDELDEDSDPSVGDTDFVSER